MFIEQYFKENLIKLDKIKNIFINSDIRNDEGNKTYLSLVKDIGVIRYEDRENSGNKTSDNPEKYKLVDINDLVINPMNATIGSVGFSKYKGCLSSVYLVLKPKKNVNSNYYHYVFHDIGFQKFLKTISYGIMEIRESLNKTEFFQVKVPSISIEEQNKIASYLNKKTQLIDRLIEKTIKKIKLLNEQKNALITEITTKGLVSKVKMKESGIEWVGKIPFNWQIKKLKYLGKFSNGLSKSTEYFGQGFPFFSYGDFYNNLVLPKPSGLVESDELDRKKCSVKKGDVFFTRTSETVDDIGVACTSHQSISNATFSGFVIRFRPNDETLTPEFCTFFFHNHFKKSFIESRMNLVTRASLNQSTLGDLPVLIPPKNEQLDIYNFLIEKTQSIDKLVIDYEKRIKLFKEYKQSLISELINLKTNN